MSTNNKINLPKKWILCSIDEIVHIQKGKKPKRLEKHEFENSLPYLDIKAFEQNEINQYADILTSVVVNKDDIVIVWDGARSGWVSMGKKGALGSTLALFKTFVIEERYLYYFLKSNFSYLNNNTKGVGIPHIDPVILWNIKFPLPPLNEQRRIVAKIEELFSELDKGVESLKKAQEQLKLYRQSLLKNAFEGKLTNNKINYVCLKELAVLITKGASPKWQGFNYINDKKQLLFITSENVREGFLDLSKQKYLPLEFNSKQKRSILKNGDVLFNLVGASIGRAAIYNLDIVANINQAVALIRTKKELLLNKYLNFYLNSNVARQEYLKKIVEVARANLSLTDTAEIRIPLCPLEEQNEIVRILEEQFSVIDKLEAEIEKGLKKAELLRQSILKKAFEGKLVPQDPNDEPASELLKRIKAEKEKYLAEQKQKKKTTVKRQKMDKNLSIEEILKQSKGPVSAKEVWQKSKHKDDIEAFYAELKKMQDKIKEIKNGTESLLELKDEN